MGTPDFLSHLRAESDRFLSVLRDADPAAPVPSCPEWSADDLLWHLAGVQWFWGTVVAERLQSAEGVRGPERPPSHDELVVFFAAQADRLHRELSEADPAERVHMWAPDKTVGYIRRRQAHEALIHRLDAELTVGEVTPLDPDLASDGVHEALDVMFGVPPDWGTFTPTTPHLEVTASDTGAVVPLFVGRFAGTDPSDGESYDELACKVLEVAPSDAPAATVTGTAQDLDAWLWHRRDRSTVVLHGEDAVLEQLLTVLARPLD